MKIKEIKCKTILTKSNLPECDYCINPYVGCLHGCVYCYARFMRRFTGHLNEKWGEFLDIKINSPQALVKEMSSHPKKGIVFLSSVSDAYQPIEKKYKLTRQILEILLEHDFPVSILTKSDLVIRDIDLLKQFSDLDVGLTITSLEEKVKKIFEPYASSPCQRLGALDKLHKSNIKTYAFIGPIFPEITDFEAIFKAIKNKVDFVMVESLNTGCGNWDQILLIIKKHYPGLLSFYQSKFSCDYWNKVRRKVEWLSKKYQVQLKGFYQHPTTLQAKAQE